MKQWYEFGRVLFQENTETNTDELSVGDIEKQLEEQIEEPKEDKIEEEEEVTEETEEEEEIPEEEDEIITSAPRRQEILKAYPDIFKKFPQLNNVIYREREYRELFATVDDAKETLEKSQQLDDFKSDLLSGEPGKLLTSIKEADPKAFAKFVDNYLPNLAKVDPSAYYHVVGNQVKGLVANLHRKGVTSKNEDFSIAAKIVHEFVFGDAEITAPSNFSQNDNENEESVRLKREREEFETTVHQTKINDVKTRVDNTLKSIVSDNIDPKGVMSDFVKRTAIREALESINDKLDSNANLKKIVQQLEKKAKESKYSQDSLNKIRSAYLTTAKTILSPVIQKIRNEAMKGTGQRVDNSEKNVSRDRRGHPAPGRSASSSNSRVDKKDFGNKSTLDILNED